ncbi:hypothetical protein DRQ53_08165 [bacterium]|nr:MAG: hypothetical protein DRQ32_02465 [bacterium]RKZ15770.1 MAG: hypothetical protein DRQ53_08165 [bacterium]
MLRIHILVILGGLLTLAILAQDASAGGVRLELRAYPAGLIGGIGGEVSLGESDIALMHAGYNATDRHDWGEHSDESGGGIGLGVGWLHRLRSAANGWIAGARLDYWQMGINWEDPGRSGHTEMGVIQPTLTGGYRWDGAGSFLEASLSFGHELNVSVEGEDVGQGWILLAGVSGGWN